MLLQIVLQKSNDDLYKFLGPSFNGKFANEMYSCNIVICNELQILGITNLVICPLRHDLKIKFSIEPINSIMHCFDRRWQLLTHYRAWKYVFSKKYFTIFYHFLTPRGSIFMNLVFLTFMMIWGLILIWIQRT